jgi:hypothetical protein
MKLTSTIKSVPNEQARNQAITALIRLSTKTETNQARRILDARHNQRPITHTITVTSNAQ